MGQCNQGSGQLLCCSHHSFIYDLLENVSKNQILPGMMQHNTLHFTNQPVGRLKMVCVVICWWRPDTPTKDVFSFGRGNQEENVAEWFVFVTLPCLNDSNLQDKHNRRSEGGGGLQTALWDPETTFFLKMSKHLGNQTLLKHRVSKTSACPWGLDRYFMWQGKQGVPTCV